MYFKDISKDDKFIVLVDDVRSEWDDYDERSYTVDHITIHTFKTEEELKNFFKLDCPNKSYKVFKMDSVEISTEIKVTIS